MIRSFKFILTLLMLVILILAGSKTDKNKGYTQEDLHRMNTSELKKLAEEMVHE